MGFIVVQWENENSIVNEKKTVGAMDLKEGTAVDISTNSMKSRYKMDRLLVDNLVQGQQRKLRDPESQGLSTRLKLPKKK
ncbi:hypothetical protein pdam_00011190 [Pocillopora damicornis]|uniref:Uncharacterized protein n=1 Tax=Pocillopora damicornis TaxID=46731 RepID=A0A3M6TSK4_POCDA|nr:hypothetical protein pdam_00011190 [Pocillopora damicornis]